MLRATWVARELGDKIDNKSHGKDMRRKILEEKLKKPQKLQIQKKGPQNGENLNKNGNFLKKFLH